MNFNGKNIPTGQDILAQNGFVPLDQYLKNPALAGGQLSPIEDAIRVARQKLQRQRELKRRADALVKQVLG